MFTISWTPLPLVSPGSGVRVPPGAYAPSFLFIFSMGCAAAAESKKNNNKKPKRRHAGLTLGLPLAQLNSASDF